MFNQDDLQQERARQINTLKIFNDNVSEVINNAEYRLDFLSGPNRFSLNVLLPRDFPIDKPVLKISPSINHHWVDTTGKEIINAPGLLNFTRHSDLGRVVQAVIRELQLRPPIIIGPVVQSVPQHNHYVPKSIQYQLQQQYQPPPYINNSQAGPPSNPSQHFQPTFVNTPQPKPASDIPELGNLSLSELKLLNDNDEYLEAFVRTLPSMQQLDNSIESLISTNESLANENLEKENVLKEKTADLKEKVETLTDLQNKHEMKTHQYDQLVERYLPKNIRDQLRKSVKVHEDECDVMVDNFLEKKVDVETFLSTYLDKRKVTHRLTTKEERLSYQLEALEKANH